MANSKQLGDLLGPAIAVILLSEFPLIHPHLYDAQIPPVIYSLGCHHVRRRLGCRAIASCVEKDWTVLITLAGWFLLLLGLTRMFAAGQYQQAIQRTSSITFMVLEGCHFLVALTITFKAYCPAPTPTE